jgi:hypothetical protein
MSRRVRPRKSEELHRGDRQVGLAGVWLPQAVERKYPNAARELGWFWVFSRHTLPADPRAGIVRRHYTHVVKELRNPARRPLDVLQRSVRT